MNNEKHLIKLYFTQNSRKNVIKVLGNNVVGVMLGGYKISKSNQNEINN